MLWPSERIDGLCHTDLPMGPSRGTIRVSSARPGRIVRVPVASLKPANVQPLIPAPAAWVQGLVGGSSIESRVHTGMVGVITSDGLSLLSTSIPDAVSMAAADLRIAVTRAYLATADALGRASLYPVRFWNFLPSPGKSMGEGLDRYMVFNAGRHDAYAHWYGTPREFSHWLATASAVGVVSDDYVLYCLASESPGVPVENPRQTPAWLYSRRYGPKPPCFARATIAQLGGRPQLLIGGTASILGEDSVHIGDVDAQLHETLRNIAALIAAARADTVESARALLARMSSLRIYIRDAADAAAILSTVGYLCGEDAVVEAAIANVCRPELLVEIEAIAEL
jgi:chorismate lyase / 3-hydroxybenzoate synthase